MSIPYFFLPPWAFAFWIVLEIKREKSPTLQAHMIGQVWTHQRFFVPDPLGSLSLPQNGCGYWGGPAGAWHLTHVISHFTTTLHGRFLLFHRLYNLTKETQLRNNRRRNFFNPSAPSCSLFLLLLPLPTLSRCKYSHRLCFDLPGNSLDET